MNKQTKNQEEKRTAFRRFSKMGAAGLAVLSMSAFTDLTAQQLPAIVEIDTTKVQCKDTTDKEAALKDALQNTSSEHEKLFNCKQDTTQSNKPRHNLYPDHGNYFNGYGNGYGDSGYTNNYSNYCDAQ